MRKHPNEQAFDLLKIVLPDLENIQCGTHWKLTAPGFMDLVVEGVMPVYHDGDCKVIPISLAHYFEQNGDLMSDPEMQLEIVLHPDVRHNQVIPVHYQLSSLGIYQEVFPDYPEKRLYRPKLMKQLTSFACQWFRNLAMQGHKREVSTQADVK